MQKYREKPRGMSLSAWCTQQGLPKQRPAGRDPFPIKEHGLKRSLEALNTGDLDIEKPTQTNNKRQRLETSVVPQLTPIQQKVAKLTGPSQGDLLRRQSLRNVNSRRSPLQPSILGTTPSRAGRSRQDSKALEAAINASLTHEEPDVTDETDVTTAETDGLAGSSTSSLTEKYTPKPSITEATGSRRRKASTSHKPSGDSVQAAFAMPSAIKPSSEGLIQAGSSEKRTLPTAYINLTSPSGGSNKETCCEEEFEIPSSGTTEYDRYVDLRLEEYLAEKEVQAKRAMEVDKMPSEDSSRIKSSESLMAYAASLLKYGQDHKRRSKIHKDTRELTEEESAVISARLPARPVLPPMIGHEIAAKVHLEVGRTIPNSLPWDLLTFDIQGTSSHAKHRFRIPARPNGKIEPIWKSPESRPLPPNPRSSAIYQQLRGRELYKMGPKRARTRYVPPRRIVQSASAVHPKAGEC